MNMFDKIPGSSLWTTARYLSIAQTTGKDDMFPLAYAVYVNVMKNTSVDCDCCAVAEDPCIADIGILVSTDPIAID